MRPGLPAILKSRFSPFDLEASLLAWWDAGYGVAITGAGVSAWRDRKGGYTLTQGTDAARPAYSVTGFNGFPGLTLDGTDDFLTMESMPFPSGSAPSEVFVVFQQNALVGDATALTLLAYGTTGNFARSINCLQSTLAMRASQGNGASVDTATDNAVTASSRHLAHATFGSAAAISVDGNTPVSTASTASTGTTRVRIGAGLGDTPAAGFFNGIVSDVLICGPLSTGVRAAVTSHLMKRRRV